MTLITNIDTPGLRDILWHRMRDDLASFIPEVASTKLLMCPACGRFLPQEDFGLEHIIPQQALKDDHLSIRDAVNITQRSGTTLLCRKELIFKGRRVHGSGCNSWKGKYFDTPLRELFNGRAIKNRTYTSRQSVSLLMLGYLAAVDKFGYRIVLDEGGLLLREQFFLNPYNFIGRMPLQSQMVLTGGGPTEYREDHREYWSIPFKFVFERVSLLFIVRTSSMYLPIYRDPKTPIAKKLRFAPPKHILRPNFVTAFD